MEPAIFVLGGALWINLLNTVCMHNKLPTDMLSDPSTALKWLKANELVPASTTLTTESLKQLCTELVTVRNWLEEALHELEHQGTLSGRVFEWIRQRTDSLSIGATLTRKEGSIELAYEGTTVLDHALYRIIHSWTDTLEYISVGRIRKCEHDECILRFVDTSKSGKRRWCSMELCGNRHKAAEFYAKRKRSKAVR